MKLILNHNLKKQSKHIAVLLCYILCFSFNIYSQDQSFEVAVPSNWSTTNGSLSVSSNHFKLGSQALKWDWFANAQITVTNLQDNGLVPSEVDGYFFNMFRMWVYNMSAISETPLVVEFYDNTNTMQFYYDFQLNFSGWRAASVSYEHEMSGLKSSNNITTMKIKVPNAGGGTLFFDYLDYTMARNLSRSADYQLPFITLDNDEHWGDIMYFSSLPKILLTPPTTKELSDLETIKQKYDTLILGSAPSNSEVASAVNKYNNLNIIYSEGNIKGSPLYGQDFSNSQNIKAVDDFIFVLAKDFKHTSSTSSKTYFLNTVRYILDQGFANGSAMETIHHLGYSFRNVTSAIHLMKNELETEGLWIEAQKMVEWYTAVDGIWEPQASNSNMDDAYTRSVSRLGACLYKSTEAERVQYLKGYKNYLENFLIRYPKEGEGVKIDYTAFHHNTYYPGYSFLAFNSLAEVINYLSYSQFAVESSASEVLKKSLLLARVTTASGDIPNSLSGRNPFETPSIKKGLKNLGLANSEDSNLIEAHNYMFGSDSQTSAYGNETPPTGFWQINFANLGVYRQSNWVADIKGFNKYFWGSEIYSSENRYGRYQNYGAVEVMYQGGHANSTFNINGWDWRKTPGATTKHLSWRDLLAENSRQDESTESNFATSLRFGANNNYYIDQDIEGDYGVFGMDFTQSNISSSHDVAFKFKKSVFCFDGKLICLGSNISSNSGLIATNLFQNYLSSTSLAINENNTSITSFPYNKTLGSDSAHWIIDVANTGYFVKSGHAIIVDRKNQDSPSETGNGTFTNGNFASAYIDHGISLNNSGYEYVIIPDTNNIEMLSFNTDMADANTAFYKVLQKNETAHIVKYNDIYGYSLFEAGNYNETTPVLSNDAPCLVMVKEATTNLYLSVVSPDLNFAANNGNSQATTIDLTIKGEWNLIDSKGGLVSVNVNIGETILTIEAKNGLPVDITLAKDFESSDSKIVYYEDFRYDAGNNGFTKYVANYGGHTNTTNVLNRVSDIPDLLDSDNLFDQSIDRPVNRIPDGNTNNQRSIAISGNDDFTNFGVDAYAVFTTLDLTNSNPLINTSDTYKYASFWTERRYGNGDLATVSLLVSTAYTGDPSTTIWTVLPLHSGKLAEASDGLTYVKGVVDLTTYANSENGVAVTLACRYQGATSTYNYFNRNGTFYFSDLQFYVQSFPLSISEAVHNNTLRIYPNPVESILNISDTDLENQIKNLRLIDISGKVIYSKPYSKTLDFSGLVKGLYFLRIETNNGQVFNRKIIKN